MKIAIVCGAGLFSGKEIMALELGQGLRSRGLDVTYVTSLWGDGKFRARLGELHFATRCMRLGFISMTLNWDSLRMTADQVLRVPGLWLAYRSFLRKEQPAQVVHTNWHHLLVLWPFLSADRDWFWVHEVVPDKPQYRHVFSRLDHRLKGWIAVSEAVARALRQVGVPAGKVHVIHNGLRDPAAASAGLTGERPLPEAVRIGIVGQVEPWKGHQDLVEAFIRMAPKHPQAQLHVFGSGSTAFEQELRSRISAAGLEARVTWHGFVADRAAIYRQMDICVVPSRTADPLPTTAIEAAFFALPVIATRCGGLPEIVEDGVTGLLVDGSAPEPLRAALDRLLSNRVMRKELGSAGRSRAAVRFGHDRFIDDFVSMLNGATARV